VFQGGPGQDKYPNRAIDLVVPSGPGGSSDLAARCYSDELAKILNVPLNVVNRPGGSGIQGVTSVVNGKKDGYTILGTTDTALLIMPVISKEVTYDPIKDVVPIGRFVHANTFVVVKSDAPFQTLEQLVDFARKNPGKLKMGPQESGPSPVQPDGHLLQGEDQDRHHPVQERWRRRGCAPRRSRRRHVEQRRKPGKACPGRNASSPVRLFQEAPPGFPQCPYDRGNWAIRR